MINPCYFKWTAEFFSFAENNFFILKLIDLKNSIFENGPENCCYNGMLHKKIYWGFFSDLIGY